MRQWGAFVIVLAALAASAPTYREEDWGSELIQVELSGADLIQVVNHLREVASSELTKHVNRISKHAELIQKAKAYSHDFSASKAAIAGALKNLNTQLEEGHNHDVDALKTGENDNEKMIEKGQNDGKEKTHKFRKAACPTKRVEEEADAKKKAAKIAMDDIKSGKICGAMADVTWEDMDIEKSTPTIGTVLRDAWSKTHGDYIVAKNKFDAAVKTHTEALEKHSVAMASFKTALEMEVGNAESTCANAHKEYAALKSEVASNVASRKQVFIATLMVTCYIDNLSNSAEAKKCAESAKESDTSKWNINGGNLNACPSKSTLTNELGPEGWTPTVANCERVDSDQPSAGEV